MNTTKDMNTIKKMLTGAGLGFAVAGLAGKIYENRTKKKNEFSKLMMPGLALAAPGLSELAIRALTEKSAASGFINTSLSGGMSGKGIQAKPSLR